MRLKSFFLFLSFLKKREKKKEPKKKREKTLMYNIKRKEVIKALAEE